MTLCLSGQKTNAVYGKVLIWMVLLVVAAKCGSSTSTVYHLTCLDPCVKCNNSRSMWALTWSLMFSYLPKPFQVSCYFRGFRCIHGHTQATGTSCYMCLQECIHAIWASVIVRLDYRNLYSTESSVKTVTSPWIGCHRQHKQIMALESARQTPPPCPHVTALTALVNRVLQCLGCKRTCGTFTLSTYWTTVNGFSVPI